ncbi:unnamed protein product [Brachionus calyciflorus]|uniref:Uncharacterized protein n=1 Tax=Brachionus calyciflorus TaxID=104777 RepID=A0A813SE37_9BILA|nr:unnamed protein product [Brachionus calyciflorus]
MKRKFSESFSETDTMEQAYFESFQNEYFLKTEQNRIAVLNQLKEQTVDLYRESIKEYDVHRFKANRLHFSGQKISFNLTNGFKKFIREENVYFLRRNSNAMLNLLKSLPGFLSFGHNDLKTIMNQHFFSIMTLRTLKLYLNDEFYFMLDDTIQINKELFAFLYDKKSRNYTFHMFSSIRSLNLTEKEIGLMIPFFLSSIYKNLENKELMKEVYGYYSNALFDEFKKNKRSVEFMKKFTYIACMGPKVNNALMDVSLM